MSAAGGVEVLPVTGIGEVGPGDDVAALMLAACARGGPALAAGDVVVVASKILAKAQGRHLVGPDGHPLDHEAAVASQTVRVVAQRRTPRGPARIVRSRSGPVLAAAGVDASNLPPGSPLLALPADPDDAARGLRSALRAAGAPLVGVIVSDTLGRAWRVGQTDTAIGAAGLVVHEDLAGTPDAYGRPLEVTDRAVADEIAAAADLVKGKAAGVPVAVVRGLAHLVTEADGAGAAALLRDPAADWFRFGHAEAARAAIGLLPEEVPAVQAVTRPGPAACLEAALATALAAPAVPGVEPDLVPVRLEPAAVRLALPDGGPPAVAAAAGLLAQRIAVAAWAEGLPCRISAEPGWIVVGPG